VVSGASEQADYQVSEDGHDPCCAAGADSGGVLLERDVADVVERLDVAVAADDVGEPGGVGLVGGEAGDPEDGGGGEGAVGEVAVALDEERLSCPGEADLVVVMGGVGEVDGLENAPVAAAVSFDLLTVADLDGGPGQVIEGGEQVGLVPFREQDVVAAVFAQVGGVGALWPGSEDVLLRPRPLRTVRAGHPAHGSSKSLGATQVYRDAGFRAAVGDPAMAVDVREPVSVRRPVSRVGNHVVLGDRLAGGRDPLFPLLRTVRFAVGVQQIALT
jgi:hypothetical protein